MSTASFAAFDNTPPEVTMPWGKHQGQPLSAVETSYLEWVATKADRASADLKEACAVELGARTQGVREVDKHTVPSQHDEQTLELARLIVECGIAEMQPVFGLDNTFGKAQEFLRGAIEREPVEDGTLAF